ncbi:PREDICTED: sorting nexin-3 [Nipponia nippon]|uniref:sorting nexin-3 n=1 Tax=Nipponia nippon TaxID=128390 RepID=UPI0005118B16|nr:PREDICTED: sorting nexin-3 [Nipponia nippon]
MESRRPPGRRPRSFEGTVLSESFQRGSPAPLPPLAPQAEPQATNLPIFKLKESTVRRRYSDFEWLRNELERESKVVVPPLPGKALLRQLPFRGDDGIFDDSFIEERKQALEQFINKVAGHPLAQNERCLHMFLQDEVIDKNYTPSKIRHT